MIGGSGSRTRFPGRKLVVAVLRPSLVPPTSGHADLFLCYQVKLLRAFERFISAGRPFGARPAAQTLCIRPQHSAACSSVRELARERGRVPYAVEGRLVCESIVALTLPLAPVAL